MHEEIVEVDLTECVLEAKDRVAEQRIRGVVMVVMSGVTRNENQCERLPVTLM